MLSFLQVKKMGRPKNKIEPCIVVACIRLAHCRRLCVAHYTRHQLYGTVRRSVPIRVRKSNGYWIGKDKRFKKVWQNINQRCNYLSDKKFQYYGGKGVQNQLNIDELEFLWFRDRAGKMVQPSIDRKDSCSHYSLKNCRFIEMDLNRRLRRNSSVS